MAEIVSFVYNKPTPEGELRDKLLPDRGLLFDILNEQDIRPLVSTGREAAFTDDETVGVSAPECTGTLIKPGKAQQVALENVGALVNRAGKSLQRTGLPPTINEKDTRLLGHDKDRTHSEVLEPLGLGMPTRFVESAADLEDFIAVRKENDFVVKPARNSNFGQGVCMMSRDQLLRWFAEHPEAYGTQLVQPRFDFNGPLPSFVKPYDRASKEHFETLNVGNKRKELRVYSFFARDIIDMFPVARTLDPQDEWFYVDPQSIPDGVYEQTHAVTERTAQKSGAVAMYSCVDFGYGKSDTSDPGFHIIEANLRSPYLLGTDKHRHIAVGLRRMFAAMLGRTVHH